MRKNDCNIVRDLIPLVLDKVASDDSRQIVEEHTACCEECKKQYEEMKGAMPESTREEYEQEQVEFMSAVGKLKRAKLKRRIKTTFLAIILCFFSLAGGMYVHNMLYYQYFPIDKNLYDIEIFQRSNGEFVFVAKNNGIDFRVYPSMNSHTGKKEAKAYIYLNTTKVHEKNTKQPQKWYLQFITEAEKGDYTEIYKGTEKDHKLIWKKGDVVQKASKEMEEYFEAEKKCMDFYEERISLTGICESDLEYYQIKDRVKKTYKAVPEWNDKPKENKNAY